MVGEEILFLPIRELQAHLRKHSFSPTELATSYLYRSERIGSKLNAYATLTEELALEQAHAAEREILAGHYRGPLHGIPYALKDLVAVKGYRTTWGARPYADQKFEYNATIVEKLNQAGAVLIGARRDTQRDPERDWMAGPYRARLYLAQSVETRPESALL